MYYAIIKLFTQLVTKLVQLAVFVDYTEKGSICNVPAINDSLKLDYCTMLC